MERIKLFFLACASLTGTLFLQAQGVDIDKVKAAHPTTAADRAIRNALSHSGINMLAENPENEDLNDVWFSNEVPSKGITDQKQ